MSGTNIRRDDLESRIKETIQEIEDEFNENSNIPRSHIENLKKRKVSNTIADYFAQVLMNLPNVDSTSIDYGSGDTGRQAKLSIYPNDNTTEKELEQMGNKMDAILSEIFPMDYIIGIRSDFDFDEDGHSYENNELSIFLVYQAKSHGAPQEPPGTRIVIGSYRKS